nr:NB-ARC domain-containing protein [Armatimonas sp.]
MGSFINANITSKESWSFELLGGVSVRSDLHQLEDLVGKKPGALLALLALSPGRTRPREEVIDLIWPEVDFDNARNRFKQTLAALRKQLEPAGAAPGSVLIADRTQVGIAAEHKSDVAEFQQSLRSAAMATEPVARAQHLRAALALYKGEFAPGFYLDVLLTERERLSVLAQSARERLAELEATPGTEVPLPAPVLPTLVRTENHFFGRASERDHLRLLLQDFRQVTLLGPGGTGKTRLTQELQTETPHSHFISLSSLRNGASIPDTIISALALPDSTDTALVRLQAAFVDKPTLLILDNVEQLVTSGGAEAIASILEAVPTLCLLATSRIRLDLPQECVCQLAPLPEDDALALFCDRARLAKSSFALTDENEEAIVELCRRLDGLPLAIELAAARSGILTPQQILERLSRRFDLLADKRRDREERHTSLRAALDWGWSLLSPDVQQFFAKLCIFRGSFSLEAAETVTGEFLAIDYLQSLADSSFLVMEVGGERFRLLETLREYGLEKLSKDDSDILTRAHAEFFLDKATQWRPTLEGTGALLTMGLFKQEQDNLIAALERTLSRAPELAVELCLKMTRFWFFAYWHRLTVEYLHKVLTVAEQAGLHEKQLARLHSALGSAHTPLKEYTQARIYLQRYHIYLQTQQDDHLKQGSSDETLSPLKRSIAGSLHNLAGIFYYEGHLNEAQKHLQEAIALNKALGNHDWLARNLNAIGAILIKRGLDTDNLEERVHFFEQALDAAQEGEYLARHVHDDFFLCGPLHTQTYLFIVLGQFDRALPFLEEGFRLACQLEHWAFVIDFLNSYHHQAIHSQRWEEAVQFHGAAQGLTQRWNTSMDKNDSHLRPQINLPEILGQTRYDLLYEAGFHASLEALQTLASGFHQPAQRQAQTQ